MSWSQSGSMWTATSPGVILLKSVESTRSSSRISLDLGICMVDLRELSGIIVPDAELGMHVESLRAD